MNDDNYIEPVPGRLERHGDSAGDFYRRRHTQSVVEKLKSMCRTSHLGY